MSSSGLRLPRWALGTLALAVAAAGCAGPGLPPAARPPAAPASTPGPPFFVAPAGRDSNPGTRRRPFGTLAHALERLRAGDRLYVRGGTYPERVKVHAAPGRRRERGARPQLPGRATRRQGSAVDRQPAATGRSAGSTSHGPEATPTSRWRASTAARGWRLTGAEIWGAHSTSGLHIDDGPRSNLGRWTVNGNCIHDTHPTNGQNQDHNIYVDDMSSSPNPRGVDGPQPDVQRCQRPRHQARAPAAEREAPQRHRPATTRSTTAPRTWACRATAPACGSTATSWSRAEEANVLGFELNGRSNVVRDNIGAQAPRFLANTGGSRPLVDGGGNRAPRLRLRLDRVPGLPLLRRRSLRCLRMTAAGAAWACVRR